MAELVPMALVLFGLLAVYAILIPGRRADPGNWHDTFSGLGRPAGAPPARFPCVLALLPLVRPRGGSLPFRLPARFRGSGSVESSPHES